MKLPDKMYKNLLFVLTQTVRSSQIYIDKEMAELGLTQSQWLLLSQLYFVNGCTQKELAHFMGIGKGPLSQLVNKLEAKNWVYRKANDTDGRSFNIFITEAAYPMVKELNDLLSLYTDKALTNFSEEDIEYTRNMVNKMRLNIRQEPESKKWQAIKSNLITQIDSLEG